MQIGEIRRDEITFGVVPRAIADATANQHDILTGSNADGTLLRGMTCADWTSTSAALRTQVGHADGFGPGQSTAGTLSSWNAAHLNTSCANTAPGGGAGRFYCFARE
jgi:hypothetical protein